MACLCTKIAHFTCSIQFNGNIFTANHCCQLSNIVEDLNTFGVLCCSFEFLKEIVIPGSVYLKPGLWSERRKKSFHLMCKELTNVNLNN